jgi:hypothetical protein
MAQLNKRSAKGLEGRFNRLLGTKANIWVTTLVTLVLVFVVIGVFRLSTYIDYNRSDAANKYLPESLTVMLLQGNVSTGRTLPVSWFLNTLNPAESFPTTITLKTADNKELPVQFKKPLNSRKGLNKIELTIPLEARYVGQQQRIIIQAQGDPAPETQLPEPAEPQLDERCQFELESQGEEGLSFFCRRQIQRQNAVAPTARSKPGFASTFKAQSEALLVLPLVDVDACAGTAVCRDVNKEKAGQEIAVAPNTPVSIGYETLPGDRTCTLEGFNRDASGNFTEPAKLNEPVGANPVSDKRETVVFTKGLPQDTQFRFSCDYKNKGGTIQDNVTIKVVVPEPVVITTPSGLSIPDGTVGRPYSFQFKASGDTGPYRWSLSSKTYPLNNLSLDPVTGVLRTTDQSKALDGLWELGVTVTDSKGVAKKEIYTWTVAPSNIRVFDPASTSKLVVGEPFLIQWVDTRPDLRTYRVTLSGQTGGTIAAEVKGKSQVSWSIGQVIPANGGDDARLIVPPGQYAIIVERKDGSGLQGQSGTFEIAAQGQPPVLTQVTPATGKPGQRVPVVIKGLRLAKQNKIEIEAVDALTDVGMRTGEPTTVTDTQIAIELTILANAQPGRRAVVVTTPDGQSNKIIFTVQPK